MAVVGPRACAAVAQADIREIRDIRGRLRLLVSQNEYKQQHHRCAKDMARATLELRQQRSTTDVPDFTDKKMLSEVSDCHHISAKVRKSVACNRLSQGGCPNPQCPAREWWDMYNPGGEAPLLLIKPGFSRWPFFPMPSAQCPMNDQAPMPKARPKQPQGPS